MFFEVFLDGAGGLVGGGGELVDSGLCVGEVAGDDQRRRDEVRLVFGGAAPGADDQVGGFGEFTVLVLDGLAGSGGREPAVGQDQVDVVVHDLVPVGHELFVDVVFVEQWDGFEAGQQVVAEGGDQVVRCGVFVDSGECVAVRGEPVGGQCPGFVGELLELGGVEDGLLDLAHVDGQVAVAGAVWGEEMTA